MPNTVTITKILEGRHNQFHIYIASDGQSGELDDEVLIDPVADLGFTSAKRMRLEHITYTLSGFSARIEFDKGLEDPMIWVLEAGTNFVDFRKFGGLKDRSDIDGTGKLKITTTGFSDSGDQGSLVIQVKT